MRKFLFIVPLLLISFSINTFSHSVPVREVRFPTEWEIFVEALIYVESRGITNLKGSTGDVGILQITPIYIKEANRLQKDKTYTLKCRYSPELSLEMFEIIQNHHNPSKNIDRAIKLHNPGAGDWYAKRIKDRMKQIKSRYV